MSLREQLKALLAEVKALAEAVKAEAREFTDEEAETIEAKHAAIEDLEARIKKADEIHAKVKSLAAITTDDADDDPDAAPAERKSGRYEGLGERFVKSEAYKAFQGDHPSGLGNGSPVNIKAARIGSLADVGRKADPPALALPDAHVAPLRFPTISHLYDAPLTLLDLITRGTTGGAFEYLQIIGETDNAAAVDEGGTKPLSGLETELADAKVYTYADGFDVTNQMLSDAPALATFLESRLSRHLENKIESVVLSGAGTAGEPAGILHTSGVQAQAFDTDAFRTVRKAITKVTRLGGQVTAVLLSPEDDEEWDLAQDANQRYYGQGPFGSGPGTAWGRPRVVSQKLTQGQFILGDFRTVTLLDREGVSVLAFNQHADYARKNKTYVRAECRAAQAIFEPALLVVGDLTAPTG